VLDVQTDFLGRFRTRVVVPLDPSYDPAFATPRLNPVFEIEGETYTMVTQSLAAVPEGVLGEEVEVLQDQADRITAALDMLFHGF
jgi:toxin CcdB